MHRDVPSRDVADTRKIVKVISLKPLAGMGKDAVRK